MVVLVEYPKRSIDEKKAGHQEKQIIKNGSEPLVSLTDLPSNVLIEILTRLPLRTLLVSRSVCKTFMTLSTLNPHFINLYSSNAPQILIFQFRDFERISCLLHVADQVLNSENSTLKPLFELPVVSGWYTNNLSLANSCRGLLCFQQNAGVGDYCSLVCNPATSEYITIPYIDNNMRFSQTMSLLLGFSPGTNQYKVLRIFRRRNAVFVEVEAQVFVIGSDSWRDVNDTPHHFFWDLCPTFLKGFMYWYNGLGPHVISFDFEREKFGEVAFPPKLQDEQFMNKHDTCIGVLGGCLCLSCNDSYACRVDLWLLRKCGNQESWRKEFVVDTTLRPRGWPVNGEFKPLHFLENGEILMRVRRNTLVCYDPRTKTLRFFWVSKVIMDYNVVALTPSFVPLKDALKVEKVSRRLRPRGDEKELCLCEEKRMSCQSALDIFMISGLFFAFILFLIWERINQ